MSRLPYQTSLCLFSKSPERLATTKGDPHLGSKSAFCENHEPVQPCGLVDAHRASLYFSPLKATLSPTPCTPTPEPHNPHPTSFLYGSVGFDVLLDEQGCGFESGFDLSLGVKKRNCLIQESNNENVPQAMQQQRESMLVPARRAILAARRHPRLFKKTHPFSFF